MRGGRITVRSRPEPLRDGILLAVVVAVVLLVSVRIAEPHQPHLFQVLGLTAAAVGACAALLADLTARLRDAPRVAWCGAAFAVHSLVILPSATVQTADPQIDVAARLVRLVAYVTVVVLLLLAVQRSRRGGIGGGWAVAVGGTVLALVAGQIAELLPADVVGPFLERSAGVAVLCGWIVVAVVYIVIGVQHGRSRMWRVGMGLGILAIAYLYRITTEAGGGSSIGFAALLLLGLSVVAAGMAGFWVRVYRELRDDRARQAEELRIAALHLQRAADASARRDHELRNGIGGLIGVTDLLSAPENVRSAPLRAAVLAELGRLNAMLGRQEDRADGPVDVGAILREVAALHRARGTTVSVDVPGALAADLPGDVLRQVLANLLANTTRHARGAPVELTARAEGTIVVVEVRDHGPGLPRGLEEAVFEAGVCDPAAGGSGLGLSISRELLADVGGTLSMPPADPSRPGCAVRVTLPTPSTSAEQDRPASFAARRS